MESRVKNMTGKVFSEFKAMSEMGMKGLEWERAYVV